MDAREAIQELFEKYADDVYTMAFYWLPQGWDPKDVVQDVFLRAFEHWDSFRGDSSAKTWLLRITRNCVYDVLRKKRVIENYTDGQPDHGGRRLSSPVTLAEVPAAPGITWQSGMAEDVVSLQAIEDAILKLKDEFRAVLILRTIDDLSVPETARTLNWSESKVRVTLHRARRALRQLLTVPDGAIANEGGVDSGPSR